MPSYPNIFNFRFVAPNFNFGLDHIFDAFIEEDNLEATLLDINWDEPVNIIPVNTRDDINLPNIHFNIEPVNTLENNNLSDVCWDEPLDIFGVTTSITASSITTNNNIVNTTTSKPVDTWVNENLFNTHSDARFQSLISTDEITDFFVFCIHMF